MPYSWCQLVGGKSRLAIRVQHESAQQTILPEYYVVHQVPKLVFFISIDIWFQRYGPIKGCVICSFKSKSVYVLSRQLPCSLLQSPEDGHENAFIASEEDPTAKHSNAHRRRKGRVGVLHNKGFIAGDGLYVQLFTLRHEVLCIRTCYTMHVPLPAIIYRLLKHPVAALDMLTVR